MGIESTRYITREDAIDRIKGMSQLFIERNYLEIEAHSFEQGIGGGRMLEFVDNWNPDEVYGFENWTDEMLGNYMDNPFFRYAMFENYLIEEENK